MKRSLLTGLAGLLLATTAVPAGATPPASPAAVVWHINGVKAHYDAFEISADRCQYRRLALEVVQNAQRDGASTGYHTIVSGLYLASNMCDPNGKLGALYSMFTQPLPASALTFDRDLSAVRLAGRVTFSDDVTGATVPMDVDVTWNATTDPLHFSGGQRFHAVRCGYTEHATGYFRGATASGAVTGLDGTAYLPSDPQAPDIGVEKVDDGIVDVGCPGAAAARISQVKASASASPSATPLTAYSVASQGSLAIAGPEAFALWSRMDPDGCHRTSLFLSFTDETVRDGGPPVEAPGVDGIGYVDDLCTHGQGAAALFRFDYGGEAVQSGGIVIDKKLGSASAHFTVEGLVETIDSFAFVPVTVDVEWVATGDPVRSTGGYRFHLAEPRAMGCSFIENGEATTRSATATGTVMFGDIAAASGQAEGALLADVRDGQQGDFCW